MKIAKGTRIRHYEILDPLGAGGMGQVYLAEDTQLRRKVAMKFLATPGDGNEVAEKRLLREARAAATLDHPNICSIYEVGEENGLKFIVLQYIDGVTLSSKLRSGTFELSQAFSIALQVAGALSQAHARGIIHRDIKPENIMINGSGQVKVLDFGLAKVLQESIGDQREAETLSQLSVPGLIMGTLPYMSPEQVRGEELDSRSDIFSFGCVVYEMLSGKRPFEAASKAEIILAILTYEPPALHLAGSSKLESFVRKCMEKDPARRYQTMSDLIAHLQQIRGEADSLTAEVSIGPGFLAERPHRTDKLRKPVIAMAVILILLAMIWYAMFRKNSAVPSESGKSLINSPAYDDYIRGKVKISSESRESNNAAITLLEKAVAADPRFAPAYAELARAYNMKAFYYEAAQRKDLMENAEVAIQKALALDPNLAEAHFARGVILWTHTKGFPHELAIQSYRRALSLNPNLDDAYGNLGTIYLHIGLLEKARSEVEKALQINPNNTLARFRVGVIDLYSGKYEDAISIFKNIPQEVSPSNRDRVLAIALFQSGKTIEATEVVNDFLKTYPADEGGAVTSVKAMLLAKEGKSKEAEEAIQHAIEIGKDFGHFHHTMYNIASAYAILHKPEEAVRWLQNAADDGFPCYPLFEIDANLNPLRNNAQFIAFMQSLRKQWERYRSTQ